MKKALVVLVLALAGCDDHYTMTLMDANQSPQLARFQVRLVGTFYDPIAYGDKRGVYTITDTATGTEYVGVSGVGIAETGIHGSKARQEDER